MKTNILPLILALIVALGLMPGCKGGPTEEELALAAARIGDDAGAHRVTTRHDRSHRQQRMP